MTKLAVAIAIALGATCAWADDTGTPGAAGAADTGTSGKATAATGAGDTMLAKQFWQQNSKDGYLGKEDVARFKGADGKNVDMQALDTDNDGRVSEREWNTYQQTAGAAGKSPQGSTSQKTTQ